jgi:hypothetical protein
METGRVISSGIKLEVAYPTTVTRGSLAALYLPNETLTAVESMTFDGLFRHPQSVVSLATSNGNIGTQVNYMPVDNGSFNFVQSVSGDLDWASTFADDLLPIMVIFGISWPLSVGRIEMELVLHAEGLGGIDPESADDAEPSLVTSGVTMDQVANTISESGNPIINALDVMAELIPRAMTNVRNSQMGRGPYAHLLNGNSFLSGTSNSWRGPSEDAISKKLERVLAARKSILADIPEMKEDFISVSEEKTKTK